MKGTSNILMGANLALNIVLSSSLALLWGLLNSLQIVAHFKLLKVVFPSNVEIYFEVLYEISNVSIIPRDELALYFMELLEVKNDTD